MREVSGRLRSRQLFDYRLTGDFGRVSLPRAMMVWLDFSGYLIMMGAAINAALQEAHDGKLEEKEHFWQLIKTEHDDAKRQIVKK